MSEQIIWKVDVCRRLALSEAGMIRYARYGRALQITSMTIAEHFRGTRVSLCHAAIRAIQIAEYQRNLEASARLYDDGRCGGASDAWQGTAVRDDARPVHAAPRIVKSRPVWPTAAAKQARLTAAELAVLLEGHDWQAWATAREPMPDLLRKPASAAVTGRIRNRHRVETPTQR